MDPIFKFPASPGTPLFPVSPERANRQHLPALPLSPSLPSNLNNLRDDPFALHSRNTSDVQGKVTQFNNLSKEVVQRRKDNEAALKRAVVGREEAEGETRRLREECRTLRKEIEEGRGREQRVGERLEGVMEELHRTKETHGHSQARYEKEVRRARKEAFKSSSVLVKLQEELKSTRNAFSALQENTELQRAKVERREEETFAAQYQLVGVQEELEKMRHQIKLVEEERDTLKSNLREEEVARIAAEGRIVLPVSRDGDEFASPKKEKRSERRRSGKENVDREVRGQNGIDEVTLWTELAEEEVTELTLTKKKLSIEKESRLKAEATVEFMKLERQFENCSCRTKKENKRKERESRKGNVGQTIVDEAALWTELLGEEITELTLLKEKLNIEKELRRKAEEQVEFMNMECLFKCCSCRIAERKGYESTPDPKAAELFEAKRNRARRLEKQPSTTELPSLPTRSTTPVATAELLIEFSPLTGTFNASPSRPKPQQRSEHPFEPTGQVFEDAAAGPAQSDITDTTRAPLSEDTSLLPRLRAPYHEPTSIPSTPRPHVFDSPPSSTPAPKFSIPAQLQRPYTTRVISTTTTVPLADVFTASMSREEALEQIEQRRGRARSIAARNLTPRRQMVEGAGIRRDISAPAGRL